ncbi:MAG: hypothetical protein HY928_11135 [Elusimicrobia bacterium]|nr:hypothetical protein [Elusimicrobiota bacterium]
MTTPTPLVRALARVLVLAAVLVPLSAPALLAKPAVQKSRDAAVAVEWLEVRYVHNGKTYVYYYPKNAPFTNDGGHERINFYTEPVLDNAHLARSHLWRLPAKGEKFKIHLITEQGAASDIVKGGTAWTEKTFVPPAPRPAPASPVRAEPAPTPNPGTLPPDPAPSTRRNPGPVPNLPDGKPLGAETGPIGEIGREVTTAEQMDDIAKRIAEFTWNSHGEKSFIHPESRSQSPQEGIVLESVRTVVRRPERRQHALWIYYVIGAGSSVPSWVAKSSATKKYLIDERALLKDGENKLVDCLGRWQFDAKDAPVQYCNKQPDQGQRRNPYQGKPEWAAAFILDAGTESQYILQALQRGVTDIARSVGTAPNSGPRVPGGSGGRIPALPAAPSSEFGVGQLFGAWGDPNVFSLDGRLLSLVVRTKRTIGPGDPPSVELTHELGLYDISNPSDIYGKRIPIDQYGSKVMALIGGGKQYKIDLTPSGDDVNISIARPEGSTKDPADAMPVFGNPPGQMPSINSLFQNRAKKALESGNRVMIAGRAYRVTGEATNTGNLLFWDEQDLEAQRAAIEIPGAGMSARRWMPAMMTEVNKLQDGQPRNLSNKVSLGRNIGGKWQGLQWNEGAGIWEPAEGDDFKPVPTAKPDIPGPQPGPGTQPSTPATANPGQGGARPDPAQTDGWPGEIQGGYRSDNPRAARLNEALSPAAKERVRFYAISEEALPKGPGQRVMGVTSKTPFDKQNIFHPHTLGLWPPGMGGTASAASEQEEIVLSGRVLASKTDRGITFVDLEKVSAEGGDYKTGDLGYYLIGAEIKDIADIQVLGTVLRAAGFGAKADEAVANLRKALAAEAPVKGWNVSGPEFGKGALKAGVNGKNGDVFYCLYPEYKVCNQGAENAPDRVPNVGQGFPLDPTSTTQVDGAFRDATELASGKKLTRVDPKPADAALYFNEEDGKKSWYIAFAMTSQGGGARRSKEPTLAFRDPADNRVKLPKDIQIGGLTLKGPAPDQVNLSVTKGDQPTIEASGFIAATGQSKDACLGVVAWWGMDKKAACDRCGAKMDGAACVQK